MIEKKHLALFAAALAVVSLCAILASPDASATGEDISGKGEVHEVGLIANHGWQYTPTFPSDVGAVTVAFDTNEIGAAYADNKVTIPSVSADKAGQRFNVVLKATSADPDQTAYQWIRFTVYSEIQSVSKESISATEGKTAYSTAITNAGDIAVEWTLKTGSLPAGLTLNESTGVVSGKYTGMETGISTVEILGSATKGPAQSVTKEITVTYAPYCGLEADKTQILTYKGNSDVTVKLTPTFPVTEYAIEGTHDGFSVVLNEDKTGTLTVAGSADAGQGTVTITAKGEAGTASVSIDYLVEDVLTISGPTELVTKMYKAASAPFEISGGSANTVKLSDNAYGDALAFSDGKLTISYPQEHAAEHVTITVTSQAGQTATATIDVAVEFSNGYTEPPSATGIYAFAE